jgi:hypothetical protein
MTTNENAEPTTADGLYDQAIAYASQLGSEHGASAATWIAVEDDAAARRLLTGIEDGDPEVLDSLPSADLSGEWADGLTGPALVAETLAEVGVVGEPSDEHLDWFDDICSAYEMAYGTAVEHAVTAYCQRTLTSEEN